MHLQALRACCYCCNQPWCWFNNLTDNFFISLAKACTDREFDPFITFVIQSVVTALQVSSLVIAHPLTVPLVYCTDSSSSPSADLDVQVVREEPVAAYFDPHPSVCSLVVRSSTPSSSCAAACDFDYAKQADLTYCGGGALDARAAVVSVNEMDREMKPEKNHGGGVRG